jgi:hypothetical protein
MAPFNGTDRKLPSRFAITLLTGPSGEKLSNLGEQVTVSLHELEFRSFFVAGSTNYTEDSSDGSISPATTTEVQALKFYCLIAIYFVH